MKKKRRSGSSNTLRIIGGEWRGRKLHFVDGEGLRPTTDRVRETLFNWLAPTIQGARCLDLFAGTGALGLEALSRGAGEVVFVDNNPQAIATLNDNLTLLEAENAKVVCSNALTYLEGESSHFDVIFLDPPFRRELLEPAVRLLAGDDWLAHGARIYLELESEEPLPELPTGWELLRSKKAGQVAYHLVEVGG